ncbi:MAG: SET domain-containing protein [Opitutales bacterium]
MENLSLSARTPAPAWAVKHSPIHGQGIFATRGILPDTVLVEYTGPKVLIADIQQRNGQLVYWMAIDERWAIDGDNPENPARFANHACDPNCDFEIADGRIFIVAREQIEAGEEITVDYGLGLEGLFQRKCTCGSTACIGYIVSEPYRPAALRLLNQMRRKSRIKP